MDYTVIRIGDTKYPRVLSDLPNPPGILYAKGNLELFNRPAVAIVGTRACTRYGIAAASNLARACAEAGICVVSGLAEGIDGAAHRGALEAKNRLGGTIAVLGNGLNAYYPAVNMELQDEISKDGLLISEYPPDFRGGKTTFPQRNRIIAALSQAVIVVEADIKSGAIITADVAVKIHRDLFAIPGNIDCYAARGTNKLIADQKARILCGIGDIMNYFGAPRGQSISNSGSAPARLQEITFEENSVLNILKTDKVHFDELIEKIGTGVKELSSLLTKMELRGLIEKLPGNMFASVK
jgi:DNA processing protein